VDGAFGLKESSLNQLIDPTLDPFRISRECWLESGSQRFVTNNTPNTTLHGEFCFKSNPTLQDQKKRKVEIKEEKQETKQKEREN
jgi:hypothetical protein